MLVVLKAEGYVDNKMNNKTYHTVGTVAKSNSKIDTLTHKYMVAHFPGQALQWKVAALNRFKIDTTNPKTWPHIGLAQTLVVNARSKSRENTN